VSGLLPWLGVGLLGGVGAVARFVVSTAIARRGAGWFPYGTLVVNLSGSALLGLVAGLALHGDALTVVAGGLLGSYTTFSTWMLDSERLAERHVISPSGRHKRRPPGDVTVALAANLVGSVLLGLAAVALGRALGGML
jgi:fluoride exporter